MSGPLALLIVLFGAALLVALFLVVGRLVDACWAVADRWHDRRTCRRLNDAALSDASVAWAENEARR